jgi:hypothetical protein
MPTADTSFSMALLLCCNKVWLANCNEQQIRRLYLRSIGWPYMAFSAASSRPQRKQQRRPQSFQDGE